MISRLKDFMDYARNRFNLANPRTVACVVMHFRWITVAWLGVQYAVVETNTSISKKRESRVLQK